MTENEIAAPKLKAPEPELRAARETAIATLSEAFTKDLLEIEEFEARLSRVHNAEAIGEVLAITADLTPASAAQAPAVRVPLLPAEQAREAQTVMSIFGSTERKGSWSGARSMRAVAIFGSVELDFREARLPAGVVELEVVSIFGSVEITVPPELQVEMHGVAIAGSFEGVDRTSSSPDPERPLLRIKGIAALGSVEIQTRLIGESGRQARSREKLRRKEAHRLEKERRRLGS